MAELCLECLHPGYMHRENTTGTRTRLDGPVPCFAAVDFDAETGRYLFCGCTVEMPLPKEMRSRVASVSQSSRRKPR